MVKKLAALILTAALAASAGGCASVFEKEYFNATQYEDEDADASFDSDGKVEVSSYFRLKLEISRLISEHRETGTIDFRDYDGNLYDDIAAACKEVGTNTALGAYCVDYISYDIDRIVAYYEANIYVSYKRTAAEMSKIVSISTSNSLDLYLEDALTKLSESLVVMVGASMIGAEEASELVSGICREDPLLCVRKPAVEVDVYVGTGLQKIFEFRFDYGGGKDALLSMREELNATVTELGEGVTADAEPYRAYQAAGALISRCVSDESAGDTAYDALVTGTADSEGMAMAYRAICTALEIPCRVVVGRLNSEQHFWNMIQVEDDWYHVDVSRAIEDSLAQTFLLGDSYMWGRYWWDTELYPACEGDLSNSAILGTAAGAQ